MSASTRTRLVATGIVAASLSRSSAVLVPVILIPVTLSYLGTQLYGLWMAMAALTGMAAFADLGLGNGLMTKLTPCHASADVTTARRYVSNAYASSIAVAAALCGLLWLASGYVPWSALLNVSGEAAGQARSIALVCLTTFIVNIPASLVTRVLYAYQRVPQANIWQAAGALSALPLALGAVYARRPPVAVVAATLVGPLLMNIVNSIWVFTKSLPSLSPRLRHVDRSVAAELARLSGLFFALTIVTSLAANVDTLVVAHALDLSSVAEFTVTAKVFALLGLLASVLNLPLWPANADAMARGELGWVRHTTRRMTQVSILAVSTSAVVLVLAGAFLLPRWLGGLVGADRELLAGFGLWWLMLAALSPRFMVQNAAGVVAPQLIGWSAYLLISIPMKWYGARHLGMAAIPYAGVLAYALTVAPAAVAGYRRSLPAGPRNVTEPAGLLVRQMG